MMIVRRRAAISNLYTSSMNNRSNSSNLNNRKLSWATMLLTYYILAAFIVRTATQLTPVIGGSCKLNSPDVQIGGKQTQFFLRCESNVESAPGEGVWVVKSRNSGTTATRISAAAVVENAEQSTHSHPKKTAPKPATHHLVCELDSNAREGVQCTMSETCLQPVYTDSNAYLQCDSSARRWIKKHCQRGFAFSFEHQSCIAHSKSASFRQFPTPGLTPPGGLVCTYSQCSPSTPCPLGTCNNGYCCSPASPLASSFAVGNDSSVLNVSAAASSPASTFYFTVADDWPGPSPHKLQANMEQQHRMLRAAAADSSSSAGTCTSGFTSPVKCNNFGQCPPGLFCDMSVKLCCPLLLALPDGGGARGKTPNHFHQMNNNRMRPNNNNNMHQQPRNNGGGANRPSMPFQQHSFSGGRQQPFVSSAGSSPDGMFGVGGGGFSSAAAATSNMPTVKRRRSW